MPVFQFGVGGRCGNVAQYSSLCMVHGAIRALWPSCRFFQTEIGRADGPRLSTQHFVFWSALAAVLSVAAVEAAAVHCERDAAAAVCIVDPSLSVVS